MGIVVTIVGNLPPPRYDQIPWTHVQVEESVSPFTGWVVIDTIAFADLDVDPSEPKPRNVTTANATLEVGWYRLTFFDAGGGRSEPTAPVRNTAVEDPTDLPPDPDTVRNQSPLLRKKFPLPPTDPYALHDLRITVYKAIAVVQSLTWRLIDPTMGDLSEDAASSQAVPVGLVPVAFEAVTRMAERLVVTSAPDFAEQVATGRRLRGFNAGPYSESYFAPGEFARRGAAQGRPPMDQDDALDIALWALATEDARDYHVWRSTGLAPPTGVATVFDYRRQTIGYGGGSALPGGYARGGPDGF